MVRDDALRRRGSCYMALWELTFLGTGSAYPSPSRGASCMVLGMGESSVQLDW